MPMLCEEGYSVTGVDTGWFADGKFVQTAPRVWNVKPTEVRDLTKAELDGVDAIVHLAAVSNDPGGERFPKATMDINFKATIRLAQIARGGVAGVVA